MVLLIQVSPHPHGFGICDLMCFTIITSFAGCVAPIQGLVGLSLSYSLSITMLLSGLIFSFTQTEMQLVSVERTEEYTTELPTEPQDLNTQVRPHTCHNTGIHFMLIWCLEKCRYK